MAAKPPLRELIKELMSPSGLLSENIKGFESRPEQVEMLLNVFDAYEKGLISLIEAGTGTGKSIAYLLPAILWAVHHKEKTLISTKTINLQEQLIEKDIPSLLKALGVDLRAVLVKGMGNYLCLRKWHDLLGSQNSGSEAEIDTIGNWVKGTQDGSLSSLTRQPSLAIWEQIAAEPDACDQARCPHYQECFFFKARREAQEAQLLIVNHHLLFADLRTRSEEGNWQNPAILPPYQRLILDEAHHIEEIATEYFASRVSRFEMQRVMGKLASDQPGIRMGKIGQLLKKIQEKSGKEPPRELSAIINRLTIDIQMEKRALSEQIHLTFDLISYFLSNHPSAGDGDGGDKRELKLRFKGEERDPAWQLNVVPKALELSKSCLSFIQSLKGIENDLK
ncbi:MAG: dinG, partial [Chlamydiales bacterium]|nr:dinG [Chlamydiales bacterium]